MGSLSTLLPDMSGELGFEVDEAGFHGLMEKQRVLSRAAWKGSGDREISEAYRQISARGVRVAFLGYEARSGFRDYRDGERGAKK